MATKTNILWTNHSYNPWWGCLKVADECRYCYAEGLAKRFGKDIWGPAATTERRTFGEKHWREPLTWNEQAQQEGRRHRVFCASMADIFEEHPTVGPEREKLWELIEATPWLDWQLLTKRPENIMAMAPYGQHWPENVWIGTSVGTQERARKYLPAFVEIPAHIRFLSVEPMLEAVDLSPWLPQLHWVICGGESGPRHRAFDVSWAQALRDQCLAAHTPFFFKQIGGLHHDSGGRLLDGREWNQFPPRGGLDG